MRNRASCLSFSCLLLCSLAFAQSASAGQTQTFRVSSSQPWTDTGIDLAAGDTVALHTESASGAQSTCAPEGAASSGGSSGNLPLASAPAGALIARISDKSEPLLVGSGRDVHADNGGRLFLGMNESSPSNCVFEVTVQITEGPSAVQAAGARPSMKQQLSSAAQVWLKGQFGGSDASKSQSSSGVATNVASGSSSSTPGPKLPAILVDADLRQHIDGLPRRVHDHLGNQGDMVNFIIVGSQERVQAALEAADWHIADVDSKEAGLKAIVNTSQRKDYLEMPMSHLYLFDRTQDFGYEQAQAYAVVASRHHFRLWKAPFTWKDQTVWVGAGTHDVGFEKDIRTGKLTHKIDPDVDAERENIAQGLEKSGQLQTITYYLPPNPVQEAKNASGGGYHSDGRIAVLFLK
jgi:hypothetical protein